MVILSNISVLLPDLNLNLVYAFLQFFQQLLQVVLLIFDHPDQLHHLVVFLLLLTEVLVAA